MSRLYEMSVSITKFNTKRKAAIKKAAEAEWDFENDWFYDGSQLSATSQGELGGGEGEEEFANRFARAVMKANGRPCEVDVCATYLEDLPHGRYCFDKEDYKRLVGKAKKGK